MEDRCTWLSACISEKSLLDLEDYSLLPPESPTVALVEGSNGTAVCPVPDVAAAQDPLKIKKNPQENLSETVPEIQEEQCEEDGVSQNDLEALISGVHPSESNPSQSLVENPVLSGKWEACKIPGIGKRMADKIMEITESGHLRKLDHIGEEVPVVKMFTNIWGTDVVSSGFLTDDLVSHEVNGEQKKYMHS
ncbi:hypothetical protein cypCar_00010793 [Cyprinus carpio]|nr:hypothetical protein cypCar_00010793 [Cyprinus carpio]